MGLIDWLFDSSIGPPGPAGSWPYWLAFTYHASNLLCGLSMAAVPVILARLWSNRRDGVSARQFWTILAMFPSLAACRLARVLELAGPHYRLTTIVDFIAAMVAVYSVAHLPPLLRHVLLLPSRDEIHRLNNALNSRIVVAEAAAELIEAENAALVDMLCQAREKLETLGWCDEKARILDELRSIFAELRRKGAGRGN